MKKTEELLALGEPIFTKMDEGGDQFWELLNYPQPKDWIFEEESTVRNGEKFYYNPISLIEAMVRRLFDGSAVDIKQTIIVNNGNRFAVTQNVSVKLWHEGEIVLDGIATCVGTIDELPLLTPKAFTNAKKHALRQLGDLFGKSLNRTFDDLEILPIIQVERDAKSQESVDDIITREGVYMEQKFRYKEEVDSYINKSPNKWLLKTDIRIQQMRNKKPSEIQKQ